MAINSSSHCGLGRQRSQHIGQLALLLPRLQNWRQCNPDPFRGSLVRG
jgi:hypothetical protein